MTYLRLALPTPLRRSFDYLPPADLSAEQVQQLQPGLRIQVPFGPRQLIGVLLELSEHSDIAEHKLKPAIAVLDQHSLISPHILALCQWASNYYQYSVGEVLSNALPTLMRKQAELPSYSETRWRLSSKGKGLPEGALKRAPKQALALQLLQQQGDIGLAELTSAELNRSHIKALVDKGLAQAFSSEASTAQHPVLKQASLTLNQQQQLAVSSINPEAGYQCCLLEGITGSGKTEVYLQLIAKCLKLGKQALVLIPEIGLTPQTLARFQRRFNCNIVILHSGLTDRERAIAWQQARKQQAAIVMGTRSAIYTDMPALGMIIIDEEHDSSFKQQEGFRYSARDIGIKRAFDLNIPIVLGSATPSLETLHNAESGRYQHLQLTQRATGASIPPLQLIDTRNSPLQHGFSKEVLTAIHSEIHSGNQVLVFINRRGFAPTLMCNNCGHVAQCQHCDARLTVHYRQRQLRCHHCDSLWPLPSHCLECNSHELDFRGIGTERSEQTLQQLFPGTEVIRIDRDTTSRKNAMQDMVDEVHKGEPCILVGTQMLAKGHHFPDVTLVVILDADGGLFSADFRGPEKMGQLLIQVAGRAGREAKAGQVMIQTLQPEHPFLLSLVNNNYKLFAQQLLRERKLLGLPPYGHLAIIRADHHNLAEAEQLLQALRQHSEQGQTSQAQCLGPLPAPMTKKAGRFRAQLILQADTRPLLHQRLQHIVAIAEQHPLAKKVRWSVDVDPADMY
ncbi:primosomal protein N' [Dasania sp. GY-MA-18]|uniref:Replication restart protein PriA n=1 Tax=Dasania phycosphaerae TaxID=2950436 RepID=A0A9J6RHX2_9GAMM|nr:MULTISPECIES: primosomal protein N' [Dasania]MCR8921534.1 primosomal protein N' [Dasania sp. GY-MA-18]MCZ0863962.1 primosomal protein N' [Dasania phycosphaerae]MCZ0867690.1 primosomal protein N' [Dasania phycosphaerae]